MTFLDSNKIDVTKSKYKSSRHLAYNFYGSRSPLKLTQTIKEPVVIIKSAVSQSNVEVLKPRAPLRKRQQTDINENNENQVNSKKQIETSRNHVWN